MGDLAAMFDASYDPTSKPGKVLEVVNGNDVRTNLSDAEVKVSNGGYYEMNKKYIFE